MVEEIKVPDRDEITKLPRLAQVAFAARCARRVQPLYEKYYPNAKEEYLKTIENAIDIAEQYGGGRAIRS